VFQRAHQTAVTASHDQAVNATASRPRTSHIGNQAQLGKLSARPAPADLRIGPADDPLEREADSVADQVMRMADQVHIASTGPKLSRKCASCDEEEKIIQRMAAGPQFTAGQAPPIVQQVLRSTGQPLDAATRAYFEPRFGHAFDHVRVHYGPTAEQSARDVGARAYTVGSHIVFAAGQYQPFSSSGAALLAHELTHIIQQSSSNFPMELRRAPTTGLISPLRTLEQIAQDIGRLLLGDNFSRLSLYRGPVLSVVRDDLGRIYIGLNEGIPEDLTSVIARAIEAQRQRIASGQVLVVQTSEIAVGGHSEVRATNAAIATREAELGRELTETELDMFELQNVWLSGKDRVLTAAGRCEHCRRILRGVPVTSSVFKAEGGVSGTIDTARPFRTTSRPVPTSPAARTASGTITAGAPSPAKPAVAPPTIEGEVVPPEAAGSELTQLASKGGTALRVTGFVLEVIEPWLEVIIDFFGTLAAAKEQLRQESYALGFGEGMAAGLLGFTLDQANALLLYPDPSVGSAGEQIAGFTGVRHHATQRGRSDGWKFSGRLSSLERGKFLSEGFTRIKARGHTIGPNFNFDDVVEFGLALKAINQELAEAARAKQEERERNEAALKDAQSGLYD
jgi:hypothetical protein